MLNTSYQFPKDVARYDVADAVSEQLQATFLNSKVQNEPGSRYQDQEGINSSPERKNSVFSSAEISTTSSPTSPKSKANSQFARDSVDSSIYPRKPIHRRSNTEVSSNDSEKDSSLDSLFKAQYRDTKLKPSPFQASSGRNSVPVYRRTTLDAPTTVTIDIEEMTKGLCEDAAGDSLKFSLERYSIYANRVLDTRELCLRRSASDEGCPDLQIIEEETPRPYDSQLVDIYTILREGPPV
ncbi:hypothetical protein LJB42_000067 [Komagataella kurtzmanii]|nr:hypothetical protein LJB42_000067 [Komagataella kurtzmanii]